LRVLLFSVVTVSLGVFDKGVFTFKILLEAGTAFAGTGVLAVVNSVLAASRLNG